MRRIEVEAQAIEAAASTLWSVAEQVRASADRIAGGLQVAAGAGGSAGLASSATVAARHWARGLEGYAEASLALSRATEAAGLAYGLVELQTRGRFAPRVLP
ncbi:hypothetical protein [Ornithinimicrobium cryptoxanthini]|uniref:PE family protein n=1 Tax=Ornithinimicrobium cryptoxanthini TaxID=2934161 RepID=A0ABY4YEK7_9MICO|nr:hypothetical protein [Ornithinimicrobium cryptoxanthini]USQ75173.1 hypothetical protein NF557_11070 [Ornithinimicrobium cryptoxanthini]